MKKLMLFLSITFISHIAAHSIVLVHIGDIIPSYVQDCLRQIRSFNSCDVYFISHEVALHKYREVLNKFNVIGISCESLTKSRFHEKFLQEERLNKGFWRFTTERFFYIEELVRRYNLRNIFHLEYDNMLYSNLSELLPIFEGKYKYAAGTFDNDNRCIAGFIYFKDIEALAHLVKFLAKPKLSSKNDMQTLALFKSYKNLDLIDFLPILPKEYVSACELSNLLGQSVKKPLSYCKNIKEFDSIFDAAALGQYLGGIDPKNGDSTPGFINESCIFSPAKMSYEWILDEHSRRIPYAIFNEKKIKINNLHIHSKRLKNFLSLHSIQGLIE